MKPLKKQKAQSKMPWAMDKLVLTNHFLPPAFQKSSSALISAC